MNKEDHQKNLGDQSDTNDNEETRMEVCEPSGQEKIGKSEVSDAANGQEKGSTTLEVSEANGQETEPTMETRDGSGSDIPAPAVTTSSSTLINQSDHSYSAPKVPPLRIIISTLSAPTSSTSTATTSTSTSSTSNSQSTSTTNFSSSGRVTRSSQRAAQQQQHKKYSSTREKSSSNQETEDNRKVTSPSPGSNSSGKCDFNSKDGGNDTQTNSKDGKESIKEGSRKRKNRHKGGGPSSSSSSSKNICSGFNSGRGGGGGGGDERNSGNTGDRVDREDDDNDSTSSSASGGMENNVSKNVNNTGSDGSNSTAQAKDHSPKEFPMPSYNCYHMYLNIRKQIDKRRTQLLPVHPKPPQGFKDYLLNKGSYLLEGKIPSPSLIAPHPALPATLTSTATSSPATTSSSQMLFKSGTAILPTPCQPPKSIEKDSALYLLFLEQEKARHKLRIQHMIEKDKLRLSAEQEVLRVHTRAALALANQSQPFSFCTILKDEEIYNTIEPENESTNGDILISGSSTGNSSSNSSSRTNEYARASFTISSGNAVSSTDLNTLTGNTENHGSRSRYNGRLFSQWLQDIDDKWEKIKESALLRQRREAESLQAIQKLDWEWRGKETGHYDPKSTGLISIDDCCVPLVKVIDDFDLLPV